MIRWLLLFLLGAVPLAQADEDNFVQVQRGRALATAGDCIACHTAANGPAYAGGRGIQTPFGTINSANLTFDNDTGLGTWTADDFARALHEGVSKNGMHLYPAFPYPFYTRVTRADSDAIFAFLKTLPVTSNRVDRDSLPFPFSIRASMNAWNALFFTASTFAPDPARSDVYNRGAYLVEGLGHCGACHTPMNSLGGSKTSEPLHGNELQSWIAPNITNDVRIGVGGWSNAQIVEYLRTGRNDVAAASGPMAEVVQYSTAFMAEADLQAIATYLKEHAADASAAPTPIAADDRAMQTGQAIYQDTCKACHAANGMGVERLFPRLAGTPSIQQPDPTTLVRVVVAGTRAAVTAGAPTSPAMPALGWRLDDAQVAAVLTYIRNSWGNAAPAVSANQVGRLRPTVTGR